jgi:hypothetical protein
LHLPLPVLLLSFRSAGEDPLGSAFVVACPFVVIPQRSGGICGCFYPLFRLLSTPSLPQNKSQIRVTFSATKTWLPKHHIHHTNHHSYTTNSPHQNHTKSQNPLK